MLPLLKDYIEKTELSYFVKQLLPLAKKLRARSEELLRSKKLIEHKIFDTLQNQVIFRFFESENKCILLVKFLNR